MIALLLTAAGLGSAHFAATGGPACQKKVLDGLLGLHSFMYEDARDAFVEAQKHAPCLIASWGEAMTYDHPLWGEEDVDAGRAALGKVPAEAKLSAVEAGLLAAARALYGEGGWNQRHEAWLDALARLHKQQPGDDEVALFHALALYANADRGKDIRRSMQAAAIAQDVFERKPDHPGAAHYLIHACDSPEHAVLGLKAARKYAQIAPASSHALHMPSHIFVQLGMWREVEASNAAAFKASEAWAARRKLAAARADWHSFHWLAAARLEQGKPAQVEAMLANLRELLVKEPGPQLRWAYAVAASLWLSGTGRWQKVEEVLAPLSSAEGDGGEAQPAHHGPSHWPYGLLAREIATRVRITAAAAGGDETTIIALAPQLAELRAQIAARTGQGRAWVDQAKLFTDARTAQAHSMRETSTMNDAVDAMRALADAEDREPLSGPALETPAREDLGELFVRAHRFVEAFQAFKASLALRPNRAHALMGLALSGRGAGDARAADDAQAALAAQLKDAER